MDKNQEELLNRLMKEYADYRDLQEMLFAKMTNAREHINMIITENNITEFESFEFVILPYTTYKWDYQEMCKDEDIKKKYFVKKETFQVKKIPIRRNPKRKKRDS